MRSPNIYDFSFLLLRVTMGQFTLTTSPLSFTSNDILNTVEMCNSNRNRNTSDVRHNLINIKYFVNSLEYQFLSLYFIFSVIHFCFDLCKYFCTICLVLTWRLLNRQVNIRHVTVKIKELCIYHTGYFLTDVLYIYPHDLLNRMLWFKATAKVVI